MTPTDPAAIRLLAAWLQRRRALSDRLEGLLLHGPSAVERVAARADELRAMHLAEHEAMEALLTLAVPAPAESPERAAPEDLAYPPLRSVAPANRVAAPGRVAAADRSVPGLPR